MDKKILLTGDRPTGPLHLGHYAGSISSRLSMQETHRSFILVADLQALTDHYHDPALVRNNIKEVVLDYLACGIDPNKTAIVLQSQVPELLEISFHLMNYVTLNRLQQNPTLKQEVRDKHMENHLPMGFFTYPISQAADIIGFDADVVPVGEDQRPMIKQTKEIIHSFNSMHGKTLKEIKAVYGSSPRLPGIDGKSKASKTKNNAIYLRDSPDIIKEKVKRMYTDPLHIRKEDPGQVAGNVVFSYLDAFASGEEVEALKKAYRKGGVGDMQTKKLLIKELQQFLKPIQEKREELSKNPDYLNDVLREGSLSGQRQVQKVLERIRQASGIYSF